MQPDYVRSVVHLPAAFWLHLPSTVAAELASDRVARRRIAVSVAFQRTFGVINCDLGLVEHVNDRAWG